jgi:phosphoribosylformylglycinamidine synthase PurS subunit
MKAYIHVFLKPAVLDPQGQAITGALHNLGFEGVKGARQGKMIEVEIDEIGLSDEQVADQLEAMCDKLLANPVIEDYEIHFSLDDVAAA